MSYPTGDPTWQQFNNEHHVYNHNDKQGVALNVKVEKNTKGYNFEVTVIGASSVDEAMALVKEVTEKLKAEYNNG